MMAYSVYQIANDINDKLYIGITTQPLKYRWSGHQDAARKHPYSLLHQDMIKYGFEHFWLELREECPDKVTMFAREGYWIRELNTLHPYGYNLKGKRITDEQAAIICFRASDWTNEQLAQAFGISIGMVLLMKTSLEISPYKHITRDHLPENIEEYMNQFDKPQIQPHQTTIKLVAPVNREQAYSLKEVAQLYKRSERYIYRLIDSGLLETFKIGQIWHFEKGYIESQREKYEDRPPKLSEQKQDKAIFGSASE